MAVSVKGAKKIFPPYGLAPIPIPCDDFFPTNFTGKSWPTGSGPLRRAAAGTEKSLLDENKISIFTIHSTEVKLISPVSGQWLEVNDSRFYVESHANNSVRKIEAIISNVIQ